MANSYCVLKCPLFDPYTYNSYCHHEENFSCEISNRCDLCTGNGPVICTKCIENYFLSSKNRCEKNCYDDSPYILGNITNIWQCLLIESGNLANCHITDNDVCVSCAKNYYL